ncbi:MAG: hypothetical protein COB15_08675 [Flavobacteriales bacterium]|nr:MAG: hypothetical protein COB15_08675 [Flavobacteriales bacterium]
MNIEAAKITLAQKILSLQKESIIEKINKLLEKEMIVGYTVEGKPLIEKEYNKILEKGAKEIEEGNYITH